MDLKIAERIFDDYPGVVLGIVTAHDINNSIDNPEIADLLRVAEETLREQIGNTPVIEHPHITPWREAYRKFGAKPKKYPSSIENLARRVIKGDQVAHINNLVAIYNTISMRHLLPVGGEDLERITGDVWLTMATDDEAPVKLLGEQEARPPYANEVIYKDDIGTICRRWNWKEADRTKLTAETRHAFLVIEALPPVSRDVVESAVGDLAELVEQYCEGDVSTALMDRDNSTVKLM